MRNRNRSGRFAPDGSYLLPSERVAEERDPEDVHLNDISIAGDDLEIADGLAVAQPFADGLARKSILRHHKWNNLNQQAPFTRSNPPSVLTGTLGGQQEVTNGQALQVALWQGEDPETLPVTITACPVQQLPFTATVAAGADTSSFRPYGIVQFGTRGFAVSAEFDIGRGVQFTVGAAMVSLQVALPALVAGYTAATMKLAGMLSFQPTAQSNQPITRTVYLDGIAIGQTIAVPPFARSVSFWRQDTTVPYTLAFRSASGASLYTYPLLANTLMTIPVPLSDDVTTIQLTNVGVADGNNARFIFNLSL